MNKAVPKIKETAEEIRKLLKQESEVKKQNRLQALYLIVQKEAKSRSKVAQMLGFNRNSISNWLALYEAGGLEKMLEIHQPPGAKPKMTEAAIAEIEEILATEKGFRTYKEIHQMVVKKHQIAIGYGGVHKLVRYKLSAKAKSPRPGNPKKKKLKSVAFERGSEPGLKR